ncbi:MAG: glycosyltransferase family 4 protein [Caulobacteraceae bacterium]
MRIAQVCPYDIDRSGGVQAHVRDTAAALAELGHEVTVIAPRASSAEPSTVAAADAPRVRRLGRARMINFAGTRFEVSLAVGDDRRTLERLMRGGAFDVVHFHTPWTPFMATQAFLSCTAARVVTFHDTPPERSAGVIGRAALGLIGRAMLSAVDGVVAVSDAPRAHLRPRAGQPVSIIAPCTDLLRFAAAPSHPSEAGAPITILFVGRLEPRKGVMVLLKAYRMLCAEGLNVRLLIGGGGREETALRRFVTEHALPGVEFLGAFDDAEAPAVFAGCDIFCAPSPYGESFGVVLAEAMAAGKPVVAAANRGYRTVMRGEAEPFLAEAGDEISLHDRLRQLVQDPVLRQRLGEWGRGEAMQYDSRTVAPRLLAVYAEAMANHEARKGAPYLLRTGEPSSAYQKSTTP